MKIAYLDCFSGISGDMFLAALVDAGVPIGVLQSAVNSLGVDAHLVLRRVDRSGINSAKVDVLTAGGKLAENSEHEPSTVEHTHDHAHSVEGHEHSGEPDHGHSHPHEHLHTHADGTTHSHSHSHDLDHAHVHGRSLTDIQGLIRGSALPIEVQTTALRAFQLLGEAESKIHNVPVETIHFHEVGSVDAIADIVATAAGCHWLRVDRWICSPLNVGGGHVHCAHGKFPVPAPATLQLLRDLAIYSSGVQKELVTPTGAALLRALDAQSSVFPTMSMTSTGYGAGSRDIPGQPNVLRLVVGESAERVSGSGSQGRVGIIETTIDDATPEVLSYAADKLLAAGASDVYRIPVQMKKGRIGIQLTILCSPERAEELQKIVFRETTTLGIRYREEEKTSLTRSFISVDTEWGAVRIKVGSLENGEVVNYAPEYEECRSIAEKHAVPLKQVMQAAANAYLAQGMSA